MDTDITRIKPDVLSVFIRVHPWLNIFLPAPHLPHPIATAYNLY